MANESEAPRHDEDEQMVARKKGNPPDYQDNDAGVAIWGEERLCRTPRGEDCTRMIYLIKETDKRTGESAYCTLFADYGTETDFVRLTPREAFQLYMGVEDVRVEIPSKLNPGQSTKTILVNSGIMEVPKMKDGKEYTNRNVGVAFLYPVWNKEGSAVIGYNVPMADHNRITVFKRVGPTSRSVELSGGEAFDLTRGHKLEIDGLEIKMAGVREREYNGKKKLEANISAEIIGQKQEARQTAQVSNSAGRKM